MLKEILVQIQSHPLWWVFIGVLLPIGIALLLVKKFWTLPPTTTKLSNALRLYLQRLLVLIPSFTVVVISWIWAVFFPLAFGHRDEIGILTLPITPTVYAGRFFPLGHEEFNLLPISLLDGNLTPQYLLVLVELIAFLLLLDYILSPASAIMRNVLILSAFYFSAFVPFINLIVPERNLLFFLAAAIAAVKFSIDRFSKVALVSSVGLFSAALYYKEPTFLFIVGFAFSIALFRINEDQSKNNTGMSQPLLRRTLVPSLFVASVIFVFGYVLFAVLRQDQTQLYGVSPELSISALWWSLVSIPIVPMLTISLCGLKFLSPPTQTRWLMFAIGWGGLFYGLGLTALRLPVNSYYWSLPMLALVVLLTHVADAQIGLVRQRKPKFRMRKNRLWSLSAASLLIVLSVFSTLQPLTEQILTGVSQKKAFALYFNEIGESVRKYPGDIRTIYYSPISGNYNDYSTAILALYLWKTGIDTSFTLVSPSGCSAWNQSMNDGLIFCEKSDYNPDKNYDLIIAENDSLQPPPGTKMNENSLSLDWVPVSWLPHLLSIWIRSS